jgi:hypothetical protein
MSKQAPTDVARWAAIAVLELIDSTRCKRCGAGIQLLDLVQLDATHLLALMARTCDHGDRLCLQALDAGVLWSEERPSCVARTRKGTRCQLPSEPGGLCSIHMRRWRDA